MVLPVSDLEPTCCEIRDTIPAHNDQHKIGYISMKKHLHPRTEELTFPPNGYNNTELERKKKMKKENSETEADSSSCFVALVTASNLHKDALELPKDFTTLNGLKRECREIVLTDKGERAWSLDLRFNNSSETFYIIRGWRCFCNENSKKAGGFFIFNLVGNGEIPLLSFSTTESRQRAIRRESLSTQISSSSEEDNSEEASSEDECSSLQFVTLTITPYSFQKCRLRLPLIFTRENGINKPGMITLQGKDGIKQQTSLLWEKRNGVMALGNGWKDFVKANGLKIGDSFTLKLIWEDEVPVLRLCPASKKESLPVEASIRKEISQEEGKKDRVSQNRFVTLTTRHAKNNREERRDDSSSPIENRFVTLTPTDASLRTSKQHLPLPFARENGMTRPQVITLLGKDGTKWLVNLVRNGEGKMTLGSGWKDFVNANGLKIGEAITLEFISENGTPMLSLLNTESTRQQGECSKEPTSGNKTKKAENNREKRRDDSSSPIQNRFVTLTPTDASLRKSKQHLPLPFSRENGMTRPQVLTLLGKDGTKWLVNLVRNGEGKMTLGSGWKDFAIANGLKIGEAITLELILENGTPMLSLLSTESTRQQGECSKEPTSGNKTRKTENNKEERRDDSSSPIQNRFVRLTLTPEDVRECKLDLPSGFMRTNGINKLGKITLLGEKGMEWFGYLLRKDGLMALGIGWDNFCEANGVKIGESFTLEFISQQATHNFVLNFFSNSRD